MKKLITALFLVIQSSGAIYAAESALGALESVVSPSVIDLSGPLPEIPAVGTPAVAAMSPQAGILAWRGGARGESYCDSDFAQTYDECNALDSWSPEKLSLPGTLDQEGEFKIIFHSITGMGTHADDYRKSWAYKLLSDPTLVKSNTRISASLISEKKHRTFIGTIGFILEVPEGNLAGTSDHDLGTDNYSYDRLVYKSKLPHWDIVAPERLLERTPRGDYNELVLIGTHPHSKAAVKVVGIIIDCPTDKMIKLNGYSADAFNKLIATCDLNRRGLGYAIPLLDGLRAQYPVYAYSTFYFQK